MKSNNKDILYYFSIFYNNCGDAIQLVDSSYSIVALNEKALALYEVPVELKSTLIGKSFKEFKTSKLSELSNDDLKRIEKEIEENGKWVTILETQSISGRSFLGEISITSIHFEGRKYFIVRTIDVTEKVSLEKKLEKSERGFRSIINQIPTGIIIHDNGKIKYANPYFLNLINKSIGEIKGKFICELVEDKCQKIVEKQVENAYKDKEPAIEKIKIYTIKGLQSFSIQTIKDEIYGNNAFISILSSLEIYSKLSEANLRADIAEESNKKLQNEIAHHKQTRKKLIEAKTFSQNIINSSIDMMIASDMEHKITTASPSALFRFGYSLDEIIHLKHQNLYASAEDFERVNNHIEKFGEFIGEVENKSKTGNKFTSFLSATRIKDADGNIIGTMGISRDISELKRAEKELIKSENKYKDLFENLSDAILVLNQNNDFEDYNKAAINLFAINENEQYNIEDFLTEETKKRVEIKRKELRKEGHVSNFEIDIITAKGNEKVIEITSKAFFKNGKYNGSRDIIRDVSERRKYQIDLTNKQYQLQSIFENSSNFLIWSLSENFELLTINKELQDLISYNFKRKIEIGENFLDFIQPGVKPHLYEKTKELYSNAVYGKPQEFEAPLIKPNGEEIWIETFLSPIKVVGKNKYDIACLAIDITDKKKSEQRLIESLNEKEILLKEVHHRVKNNLQVISSILNLQSSYVKDENTLNILRESQNRIKSMSFIHESLYQTKDFSQVNFSSYLNNLVRNLVQSYQLKRNNIILNLELEDVKLNLDQSIPCGLIINELVSNAIKYAYPDSEKGVLTLRLQEKNKEIQLVVEDRGIGLPNDFSIKDTPTLGLQLVDSLIHQLDAKFKVELKKGTKYTISFKKN